MSTPRAVRIPRSRDTAEGAPGASSATEPSGAAARVVLPRRNVAGSQRAVRLAALFVVGLALLYSVFLLLARSAPGGSGSPEANGVLLLSAIFFAFAAGGVVFTLTPAPRSVEVAADRVVVVGRWGRRAVLPRLELLKLRVLRSYPANWLARTEVDLVEVWSEGMPPRTYLVQAGLFSGSAA